MSDLYDMHTNLSEDEINQFESWMNGVTPPSIKNTLSCYQLQTSRKNYQSILSETEPSYIYCGATGGGRNHMIYYKSRDQNVYILCFYIQEFTSYWAVDNQWEKHIKYESI